MVSPSQRFSCLLYILLFFVNHQRMSKLPSLHLLSVGLGTWLWPRAQTRTSARKMTYSPLELSFGLRSLSLVSIQSHGKKKHLPLNQAHPSIYSRSHTEPDVVTFKTSSFLSGRCRSKQQSPRLMPYLAAGHPKKTFNLGIDVQRYRCALCTWIVDMFCSLIINRIMS